MTADRRSRTGTLRAADDQPARRTTPKHHPTRSRATSPRPTSTTCAATSRCPTHDGTLEIGGAVEHPLTLTLDDLRAMPAVERTVTLECAGNGRLEMRPLPDRRTVGRLRRLHRPLDRRPPQRRARTGAACRRRRRRAVRRCRQRPVPPPPDPRRHRPGRPDLRAFAAARHSSPTRRPRSSSPTR